MRNREIRVFISSTFNDMQAERDWLVKRTFPRLRRLAADRGVALDEVDLRWGITADEAKDGRTLEICLDEINNSHPFFIGLLGNRYGWTPSVDEVGENAIPDRYDWIRKDLDKGMSITEIEMQYGVLRNQENLNASFYIRAGGTDDDPRQTALKNTIESQDRYPAFRYSTPEELDHLVNEEFNRLLDQLYPEEETDSEALLTDVHFIAADLEARNYLADPRIMPSVEEVIESGPSRVLISGQSGLGKSALLCHLVSRYSTDSDCCVIPYIAATGERLDATELGARITRLSESAGKRLKLVVVDDAATVRDEGGNVDISWMDAIPDDAVLFVSAADGQPVVDSLRDATDREIRVLPLLMSLRQRLAENFFAVYRKKLTEDNLRLICSGSKIADNTLAFVTLLEKLRRFGSYDNLPGYVNRISRLSDLDEFYDFIMSENESDFDGGRYPDAYKTVLSLLELSSEGLSEHELVGISGIPQMLISQIVLSNTSIIKQSRGILRISHSKISEVVRRRYNSDEEHVGSLRDMIICYFSQQEQSDRRDVELPFQYWKSGYSQKLYCYITDYEYLKRNIRSGRHFFLRYWQYLLEQDPAIFRVDGYFDLMPDSRDSSDSLSGSTGSDIVSHVLMMTRTEVLIKFAYLLLTNLNQPDAVERLCNRAMMWLDRREGGEFRMVWLSMLASVYGRQGKFDKALLTFGKAIDECAGDDLSDTHALLSNIAETYQSIAERTSDMRFYQRAVDLQQMVLDFRIGKYGRLDKEVAVAMSNLAVTLDALGEHEKAGQLLKESTDIYMKLSKGADIDVAINLNIKATMSIKEGNYSKAISILAKAGDMVIELDGQDAAMLPDIYLGRLMAYAGLEDKDNAEAVLEDYHSYLCRRNGKQPDGQELYNFVFQAYRLGAYRHVVALTDLIASDGDFREPDMLRMFNMRANALGETGCVDEALELYGKVCEGYLEAGDYANASKAAGSAAGKFSLAGELELSKEWFEYAFRLAGASGSEPDENQAFLWQNYAVTLYNMNDVKGAVDAMRKACDIRESVFGADDEMLVDYYLPTLEKMTILVNSEESSKQDVGNHPDVLLFNRLTDDMELRNRFAGAFSYFVKGSMSHASRLFTDLRDEARDNGYDAGVCAWLDRCSAYANEMMDQEEATALAGDFYEKALTEADGFNDNALLESIAHDYAEFLWNTGRFADAVRVYTYQLKGAAGTHGLFKPETMRCLGNICAAMLKTDNPDLDLCLHCGTILMIMGQSTGDDDHYEWGAKIVGASLNQLEIPMDDYDPDVAYSIFRSTESMLDMNLLYGAWVVYCLYPTLPENLFDVRNTFLRLYVKGRISHLFGRPESLDELCEAQEYGESHRDEIDAADLSRLYGEIADIYKEYYDFETALEFYCAMQTHDRRSICGAVVSAFMTRRQDIAGVLLDRFIAGNDMIPEAFISLARIAAGRDCDGESLTAGLDGIKLPDSMYEMIALVRLGKTEEAYRMFRMFDEMQTDHPLPEVKRLYAMARFHAESGVGEEAAIYIEKALGYMDDISSLAREIMTESFDQIRNQIKIM